MPLTTYRARHKPNTITDESTATLADWLRCYPGMRDNAVMWFSGYQFSEEEQRQYPQFYRLVEDYRRERRLPMQCDTTTSAVA